MITIEDVIDATVAITGVRRDVIIGHGRPKSIARARHVAMATARRHTGCSYPEIAAAFGGRDHTSVMHAVTVAESSYVDIIEAVEESIGLGVRLHCIPLTLLREPTGSAARCA